MEKKNGQLGGFQTLESAEFEKVEGGAPAREKPSIPEDPPPGPRCYEWVDASGQTTKSC